MTTPDDPYSTPPPGEQPPSTQPPVDPPPYYGAPPPAYGAPPPPPAYGAPPPAYGAPPPPPAYGAPPPAYGAPPPGWAPSPYGSAGYAPTSSYGSWGSRVVARIIDSLVILPAFIIVFIGAAIGGGGGAFIIIIGYLAVLAIVIWNEYIRQGRTGQTIGKQQMHVKLIRESDGQVLGPGFCFVRQLAHIVDSIPCYLGYFWPLWDDKRQTFADKVCSTVVIKV